MVKRCYETNQTQHWFHCCLQKPAVGSMWMKWIQNVRNITAEDGFTLKWELGLRRGGASARWFDPARLTTVCRCSKKFFPYCSRGRPVKLSSACEGCFVPPANLQSCRLISAHWRYTVKKESKGQFVKKAQKQTNIIAPPPFFFF